MATGTAIPLIHGPASERLRRIATYASVAVAAVLVAVKFAAWLETGSVSLLSSLVDSLLDAVASLVNLVAVRHAMSPADREHRFGHGKAEPLAVLGQSAFITGSALLLLAEAIRRLISPVPIENAPAGVAVMIFSIIVTIGLVLFQRHVVRRTGSIAITADELHYRSDVVLNISVITALVLGGALDPPIPTPRSSFIRIPRGSRSRAQTFRAGSPRDEPGAESAAADRCEPRDRARHGQALQRCRLADHHLLARRCAARMQARPQLDPPY